MKSISIAWYKGDSRKAQFSIDASVDGAQLESIVGLRESSGTTLDFESYELHAVQAQFIQINGNGNESNEWNSMLRRGDEAIETRLEGGFPNRNNWVFSSAPESAQARAG